MQGKGAARTKTKLTERVLLTCGKPIPLNQSKRKYYQITTCVGDCILQADVNESPTMVTKQDKETILGMEALGPREQMLDGGKQLVFLHHEKDARVIEELLIQTCANKVVSPTVGTTALSIAILRQNATALLMFRNERHQEVWKQQMLDWLRVEVSTNHHFQPHYLARPDIIRKLQLPPDGPGDSFVPGNVDGPAASTAVPKHVAIVPTASEECAESKGLHADHLEPDEEPDEDPEEPDEAPYEAPYENPEEPEEVPDPLAHLFGGESESVPEPPIKRARAVGKATVAGANAAPKKKAPKAKASAKKAD